MKTTGKYRKAIFYKDYFEKFFIQQTDKVKAKIIWTIELIEDLERVPDTYLKHIESTYGIYEVRVKSGNDIFRIFCFFEAGNLIIITNGFQKKTQKTSAKEIQRALKIMEEYKNENK